MNPLVISSDEDEDLPDINLPSCSKDSGGKRGKTLMKTVDMDTKKRKLQEEKAAKQQKAEELNMYKPSQCMKYISVEIHPTLASFWFMADLQREVEAAGARLHTVSTIVDPGLLVWTRTMPQKLTAENGQVRLGPTKQPCGMSLYICTIDELAERLADESLIPHIKNLRDMVDGNMSMVVFGDCSKSSRRKTSNSNRKSITELQLDQAKIDVLLETGVDMQVMGNQSELVMWVLHCTRAVAEEPYKKAKRELEEASADFYMKGDKKKSVAVNKEGHGLNRLWQQMIAVLPSSSLEIARAICAEYNTPNKLIEALKTSSGICQVADLPVSRTAVPGSRARRVGPEFTRKLHHLYISEDPNFIID